MKAISIGFVIFTVMSFSNITVAGVYKCTDESGKTSYQAGPCNKGNNIKMDIKTGNKKDLTVEENVNSEKKAEEATLLKQQEEVKQRLIDIKVKRKKEAEAQSAVNQQLIKNNPIQFSAFAIPPYQTDQLSAWVSKFKERLPDIEKFRRLAALKALATGECIRVEEDILSDLSKADSLVFSVACSTTKTFSFNEKELIKK